MSQRNPTFFLHVLALVFLIQGGVHAQSTTAPSNAAAHVPLRIALIGDSTMCDYPDSHTNRGWGQYFEEHFKDKTVKVLNMAANGRSSKTFIQEGRWQKVLDEKPDYVLIQFGHNDSHNPKNHEATDPATDYKDYLCRYVDESRAIGAIPILITPMVRRTFDAQGKIIEGQPAPNRPLEAYATAMKEVATEKKVPLIDLYTSSKKLVEELGPEKSLGLASNPRDNTHFNEKGARTMADLVMRQLPTAMPDLKNHLKPNR